jgi:hypothetical protein
MPRLQHDRHGSVGLLVSEMKYDTPIKAFGMCAIESTRWSDKYPGWGLVRVQGLTFPGREHWASVDLTNLDESELPLEVRDGTMRQFNPAAEVVWKGELDDWLDDMSELLHDHLRYEIHRLGDADPLYWDELIREDMGYKNEEES